MSQPKYEVRRARVHLRNLATPGALFRDIGIVDAASYSFTEETLKKESTNEVIGTVAKKVLKTEGTLTLTMGDTQFANFCVAVRARVSTQAAVVAGTFVLPAMAVGEQFKLPSVNITDTSIGGLTEGVDYKLYRNSGLVAALVDIPAAIPACTYSAGLAKRGAIAAGAADEYEVLLDDITAQEVTSLYRWSPNLPSNVALISPNEFGAYESTGDLLLDTSKPADGELGQFGVKYDIAAAP